LPSLPIIQVRFTALVIFLISGIILWISGHLLSRLSCKIRFVM
jgi:hypothetical protein